uniref:Secreted protein n=1 Tax=Globodera pallida TaxID=36090 RepID=A0A183BN50_GLOPA
MLFANLLWLVCLGWERWYCRGDDQLFHTLFHDTTKEEMYLTNFEQELDCGTDPLGVAGKFEWTIGCFGVFPISASTRSSVVDHRKKKYSGAFVSSRALVGGGGAVVCDHRWRGVQWDELLLHVRVRSEDLRNLGLRCGTVRVLSDSRAFRKCLKLFDVLCAYNSRFCGCMVDELSPDSASPQKVEITYKK